jgi:hypothetical protein
MSKRGKKGTPEQEVEEAAQRMRKHPESLRAARDNKDWLDFLLNVADVNPETVESKRGQAFWQDVQNKVIEQSTTFTVRQLAEANVEVGIGKVREHIFYKSKETGRFVSPKSIA